MMNIFFLKKREEKKLCTNEWTRANMVKYEMKTHKITLKTKINSSSSSSFDLNFFFLFSSCYNITFSFRVCLPSK